jgi:hypothetical protein
VLEPITLATEGMDDEAVARKICAVLSVPVGPSYPAGGKSKLDPKIPSYNAAARLSPWFVLRDLDADAPCPGSLRDSLAADISPRLLLRVPVRSIESWLLADALGLSRYLFLSSPALVPGQPELLVNPKQEMVNLARRSRRRAIREAMVPLPGMSVSVGPEYTVRLIEFARCHWDPLAAAERSQSLRRCLRALCNLYGLPLALA